MEVDGSEPFADAFVVNHPWHLESVGTWNRGTDCILYADVVGIVPEGCCAEQIQTHTAACETTNGARSFSGL